MGSVSEIERIFSDTEPVVVNHPVRLRADLAVSAFDD